MRIDFTVQGHFAVDPETESEAAETGLSGIEARVRDRLVAAVGEELAGLSFDVNAWVTVAADEVA